MVETLRTSEPRMELWFPTPIWGFEAASAEAANAEAIAGVYAMRAADPEGASQSNRLGWQSRERRDSPDWFAAIGNAFAARAAEIARKCGYPTPLEMSWWCNINGPHAYNRLHVHPGSVLSGVYYLQAGGDSGAMSFVDLRFLRQFSVLADPECELKHLHHDEVAYPPVAGRGFLFPSWVPHHVDQNRGEQDRISLSFNFG